MNICGCRRIPVYRHGYGRYDCRTTLLLIYLLLSEGIAVVDKLKRIGLAELIGARGLVAAFSGYISSITVTTAANTLFMLAAAPFIAAFLGIVLTVIGGAIVLGAIVLDGVSTR